MPRQSKIFRIFVSSTFEDMREERNTLQAGAFSRLRDYCRCLGWQFQAVDLRWGISEEATIDQKTMEICLREIHRCQEQSPRPNFIVLLGERYGWRPLPDRIWQSVEILMQPHLSAELSTLFYEWYELDENQLPEPVWVLKPRQGRYLDYDIYDTTVQIPLVAFFTQWSKEHLPDPDQPENKDNIHVLQRLKLERSATEQEIQAGAFRSENAQEHVFAFLRELPAIAQNCKSFHDEDQSQIQRLHEHIKNFLPEKNVYRKTVTWDKATNRPDANHLAELDHKVESFLKVLIDAEMERFQHTDENLLEDETHAAFAIERTFGFSGREKDIAAISNYATSESNSPFVLWGASGTGKSTLMAQVAFAVQKEIPQAIVITRFIGVTGKASIGYSLLKDICHNLCLHYGGDIAQIPDESTRLEIVFNDYLAKATTEKPLILFIDALDQFSEYDAARKLNWLPHTLPPNVRLILSTLEVDCLDILRQRNNPAPLFHEITRLTSEDGRFALQAWLSRVNRKLQTHQTELIIKEFDHADRAPLYLHLAFDRAQHWKSQDKETRLGQSVQDLITDLYTNLSRPSAHGSLIVEKVLTALRCAKQGLSDDEILGVLAQDNEYWLHLVSTSKHSFDNTTDISQHRIPPVLWIRLYHDLEFYLSRRNAPGGEVVTFYHRQLAEAIDRMYLCDADTKKQRHRALADYFTGKRWLFKEDAPLISNARKCDELPWQRIKSEDWDAVVNTLCDLDFIQAKAAAKLTYEMVDDFNLALNNIPDNAENIRIENERQARMQKYTRDLIAYAKGEIKELDIPKSITPWSKERIDAEIERIKKNPNRLDILKAYYSFLGKETFNLNRLATNCEYFTVQQAWNYASDGPVGIALTAIYQNTKSKFVCQNRNSIQWNPISQQHKILRSRTDWFVAIAITPDGSRALSATGDNNLILWNMDTTNPIQTMTGHKSYITKVSITPDGTRAISSSLDNTCILWNLKTSQSILKIDGDKYYHGIDVVCISPDGTKAICDSNHNNCSLWDLETGKCIQILKGHTKRVRALAITADCSKAISGSEDNNCIIWDLASGNPIQILKGHTKSVAGVAISPTGNIAISCSADETVILWDLVMGVPQKILRGHTSYVCSVDLTPDGKIAISGSWDKTCIIWDLVHGTILHVLRGHIGEVSDVAITSDGVYAISSSRDLSCVLWNLKVKVPIECKQESRSYINAIVLTPDGLNAIISTHNVNCFVWSKKHNSIVSTLQGHLDRVRTVAISPDGSLAICGSEDNSCILWNLLTSKQICILKGHEGPVNAVAFSPDGTLILSGSDDNSCILWDIVAKKSLLNLKKHTDKVNVVAVSPDGSRGISGSEDKSCIIWDLKSGKVLRQHFAFGGQAVYSFVMLIKSILVSCKNGKVWSIDTERQIFCPGRGIVTAHELWDYEQHIFLPISADCPYCGIRFAPDKSFIETIYTIYNKAGLKPGDSPCLELPRKAWEDPRLLYNCPSCGEGLKLNPFFPVHLKRMATP